MVTWPWLQRVFHEIYSYMILDNEASRVIKIHLFQTANSFVSDHPWCTRK